MEKDEGKSTGDERWYYEIGGHVHGPLRRTDLEDLLNCCGETIMQIQIRKGTEGEWIPYKARTVAVARLTSPSKLAPTAAASRSASAGDLRSYRQIPRLSRYQVLAPTRFVSAAQSFVSGHPRSVIATGVIWLLGNLLIIFWPDSNQTERSCVEALQQIVAEMHEMSAGSASLSDWNSFGERSRAKLAPIVRDLKKAKPSASVQLLLSAVHDLAPKLYEPPCDERRQAEQRLQQCLRRVDCGIAQSAME